MNLEKWEEKWQRIITGEIVFEIDAKIPKTDKRIKLVPFTKPYLKRKDYLSLITEWRKKYNKFFFSDFEPTIEKTKIWLESSFLRSSKNLFFLLIFQEKLIGHYAFKNLNNESVFLDNLVKGVHGGHAKIIETTVIKLIDWLFDNFFINQVKGSVLADNPYAIMSNKKIGFDFSEKILCPNTNKKFYNIDITRKEWEKNSIN